MVATPPARGFCRAAAAILLAATFLPLTPTASAQLDVVPTDVSVPGNMTRVFQGNFHDGGVPTWFVDGGNRDIRIDTVVRNGGTAGTVPVWYWFSDEGVTHSGGCKAAALPAANPAQRGSTIASNTTVSFTVDVSALPAGRAYNVTVAANVAKPPQVAANVNCGSTTARADTELTNNYGRAYFVKGVLPDLRVSQIRWCAHIPSVNGCDESMRDGTWNVSRIPAYGQNLTYFQVETENVGAWKDMVDHSCNCTDRFIPVTLNVTIKGAYLDANGTFASRANITDSETLVSSTWNTVGLTGVYNVTARIDPLGHLRQSSRTNDEAKRNVEIAFHEFTGRFNVSEFRTTSENPYPYTGQFRIQGDVFFENKGPQEFVAVDTEEPVENATTPQDAVVEDNDKLSWTVYIVDASRPGGVSNHSVSGFNTSMSNFSSFPVRVDFPISLTPGESNYLAPGKHVLRAVIDGQNVTREPNETNNVFDLEIYVDDIGAPKFVNRTLMTFGSHDSAPISLVHPHEPFTVYANITDDNRDSLTVEANFTYSAGNVTHVQRFPLVQQAVAPDRWRGRIFNFSFATNASEENWTFRVHAVDAFGNHNNSTAQTLRLQRWPIQTANESDIVLRLAQGENISWSCRRTDCQPRYDLRVLENQTGIPNQPYNKSNFAAEIVTPLNVTIARGPEGWMNNTAPCRGAPKTVPGDLGENLPVDDEAEACTPAELEVKDTFSLHFDIHDDGGAPGQWNVSLRIKDVSGQERVINRTFNVIDELPEIRTHSLGPALVEPGQNITVKANVSDDAEIRGVFARFTRVNPTDGFVVNLSLTNPLRETDNSTLRYNYTYNNTFQTGRGKIFGIGGTFNVSIEAVDQNGNWNKTNAGLVNVNDSDVPSLVDPTGIVPAVQEIRQNVTFFARARDSTNVTVRLQVLKNSEEIFPAVEMTEGPDGNFTYSRNFSAEDTFRWVMTAVDSTGRNSDIREGTLSIRDNLGPKYEVRSPSVVIDGTRYASGTPRVELLVIDTDGVLRSSVDLKVGGVATNAEVVAAPAGVDGFLVSFDVPAARKFNHRDVVDVNITATDNSSKRLPSWLNFSFVVDDVAPVARLVGVTPSYRDQPAHALNVSLDSRFTLAADDNDGVPTSAESIRFRILGGAPGAPEVVYTGPFRISDVPNVYQGPRLYQIQFWAVDSVGNQVRTANITTVWVDDTPPALFQFFPAGRDVNATFVDDRVGVDRAVVWYRLNSEPYVPSNLVEADGAWSVQLPAGVKGDRISYYLQAWDKLENTDTFGNATAPYASFNVSNQEPVIRIKTPVEGGRVSRSLDLTWDASDADNDALVFTISVKAPGRNDYRELARLENTEVRRYAVNTLNLPDGQYTFRVAVGDGGFVKFDETTVTILNRGSAVGTVTAPAGEVTPGDTVLIKAEITKAQALVEARVYLDGELVDTYPMNDEGKDGDETPNDGVYSVRVPVSDAGDYSVEIFSQYQEDGELKSSSVADAATFSAKLTPGYIFAEYGTMIALIGLLAAIGIGVAVFVVLRRR